MRFPASYGAGPLHLLATVAMLAFAAFVLIQVFGGLYPWSFVLWFVAAIVAHDLIAFPLYSLLDRVAGDGARPLERKLGPSAVNYLRIPAMVSGILLVVWLPEILRLNQERYEAVTGQSPDVFLGRWLAITTCLFAASGLLLALKSRARKQGSGNI